MLNLQDDLGNWLAALAKLSKPSPGDSKNDGKTKPPHLGLETDRKYDKKDIPLLQSPQASNQDSYTSAWVMGNRPPTPPISDLKLCSKNKRLCSKKNIFMYDIDIVLQLLRFQNSNYFFTTALILYYCFTAALPPVLLL